MTSNKTFCSNVSSGVMVAYPKLAPASATDLQRESHPYGRSLVLARALELERSAVRLGHELRDMKADPHPREGRGLPDPACERAAQPREIAFGDADALIGDRDLGRAVLPRELNRDLAAARRVLDRIPDEVHEQLVDARLVTVIGQRLG